MVFYLHLFIYTFLTMKLFRDITCVIEIVVISFRKKKLEKASALEALSISEEERQVHKSCARWCDGGCGRSHRAGTEGRPIPLGNGGMAIGQLTPKISRHLSGGG